MRILNICWIYFICHIDIGHDATRFKIKRRMILMCVFMLGSLVLSNFTQASNNNFSKCVEELKLKAKTQDISVQTINQVLGTVKYTPRVIELDRHQPEFTQTFADYFNKRVSQQRIKRGQALLVKHRQLLTEVQQKTGVAPHYLLAFWGLETNYGSYLGSRSIPNSLATLACDPRRSAYFTDELLNALRIIDTGDIAVNNMRGSWAGAMGHMQFMPTTYLHYAQDGDRDGRRDLWNSIHDAILSAGNFLQQLGWTPNLQWGQEVQLSPSFNYLLAGRSQALSMTDWAAHNVLTASGASLPLSEQKTTLLVPAGHHGPAFLVSRNFDIIMRWNRSEYYALAVGHLADRIVGGPALQRPPSTNGLILTRKQVHQLQQHLTILGIDVGEVDGILGPHTRTALSHFQRNTQRIADGYLDKALLTAIRKAATDQLRATTID